MGMYDYLKHEGITYQTKDFDCILDDLRIVNGRLYRDEWHYEEVPKHERPYPNADGILGVCGSLRRVIDEANIDMNFHGECEGIYEPEKDVYKERLFKFTDGNLVSVTDLD